MNTEKNDCLITFYILRLHKCLSQTTSLSTKHTQLFWPRDFLTYRAKKVHKFNFYLYCVFHDSSPKSQKESIDLSSVCSFKTCNNLGLSQLPSPPLHAHTMAIFSLS